MGVLAGYFRGWVDEVIMRIIDVMLSFPSQIMVFAVVALLGVDVRNVVLAQIVIKWAWYARMIRTGVIRHRNNNYISFSEVVGTSRTFILTRHLIPAVAADLVVLASLGVQAPIPEWGAMLNEAKNVLTTNPMQMIAPGVAIVSVVAAFNLLGDALRDVLDPKEVEA